jgi:hypothetical protein
MFVLAIFAVVSSLVCRTPLMLSIAFLTSQSPRESAFDSGQA